MKNVIGIFKKMNQKAFVNGDIPVSAIIIKNNIIIAKAYNKKYKKSNPIYHAEILAIIRACKKLKTTNLSECSLITTLKPCSMCEEIIKEVKINNVYYILEKEKNVNRKINFIKINIENEYFKNEIKHFFKMKR